VLHLGDVFRTTGYPVIDVDNGGTAAGTLEALQVAMDLAGPDTRIIPGHGDLSAVDDVREFRDMISVVARRVSDLIDQGMTLEQVLAAAPTADLDERWGGSPERFLTGLYQSLAAAGD
jgi:glyoxylase-like metal-dependent hydrolase (beta-lactamase superfamily II)